MNVAVDPSNGDIDLSWTTAASANDFEVAIKRVR